MRRFIFTETVTKASHLVWLWYKIGTNTTLLIMPCTWLKFKANLGALYLYPRYRNMDVINSFMSCVGSFFINLGSWLSHDNFVYGAVLLTLDIILTLFFVSWILTKRENKKWEPLRKNILISTQAFVLKLFNAYRIMSSHKFNDGTLRPEGVQFFNEQMFKLKTERDKWLSDISLYGSGMGGELLPKLAHIEQASDHVLRLSAYFLMPFTKEGQEGRQKFFVKFEEFEKEPFQTLIRELKGLSSDYPKLMNLGESYWNITNLNTIEKNLDLLLFSFDYYIDSWD